MEFFDSEMNGKAQIAENLGTISLEKISFNFIVMIKKFLNDLNKGRKVKQFRSFNQ